MLGPLEINEVCTFLLYQNEWFAVEYFRFWPPYNYPRHRNLDNTVGSILLSFFVFSPDNMHPTLHCIIQYLSTMFIQDSIILWIVRHVWQQPHRLMTPVIVWMESQCSCDLKFESNFRIHRNLPAHTAFSLIRMELIKHPNSPYTVGELAIVWWCRSGLYGIIRHKVEFQLIFRLINASVQILVCDIRIFSMPQVDLFEFGSMCLLVNDSVEYLCHSRHWNHQHSFKCWHKCWIPVRWYCLDLQQAARYRMQSLQQIPMLFFTDKCQESHFVAKSPTIQWYSPIKWTVATPLQHSQSPVCRSLLLPSRWMSVQDPFHVQSVLVAYQYPNPTSSQ